MWKGERTTCAMRVECFRDHKGGGSAGGSKGDENRESCRFGWMCSHVNKLGKI